MTSLLRELVPTRTSSKVSHHATWCSYAFSITNMFHKDKNVRLERLSHRTPTRASELATCPKNHRAPKSTPFLTRLPSHFPRGARLISRWLFLFRVRWRLFRLCRAERHSKIARLGFLYPHDRRETKNGFALGTALIRGRLWAAGSPTVVSTSIKPHRGPEPD